MKPQTALEQMAGRRAVLRQRAWECADSVERWLQKKLRGHIVGVQVFPDWEDDTPGAGPGRFEITFYIPGCEPLVKYQPIDDHPSDEIVAYVALLTGK